MRKRLFVTALVMLPLCILILIGSFVAANPISIPSKPPYATILIDNPKSTLYTGSSVQLFFTVVTNEFFDYDFRSANFSRSFYDDHCFINLDSLSYEFNDFQISKKTTISREAGYGPYTEYTLRGNTSITNLAKGNHTLEIKYGKYQVDENYKVDYIALSSATVEFTVESNIKFGTEPVVPLPTANPTPKPPMIPVQIKISSPKNNFQTNTTSIQLIFNVSAPQMADAVQSEISWVFCEADWLPNRKTLYYQDVPFQNITQILLDDEHFDFMEFNNTLSDIPQGTHKLKITALGFSIIKGISGSQDTKDLTFTVGEPSLFNQIKIDQTQMVLIGLLIAVLLILSIIIKRNRKKSKLT